MPPRTRIKICGLTREADVDAAVAAGADAIGFVLYPASPRHVDTARLAALAARLPPFVTPVCLFVNVDEAALQQALRAVPDALLQFHGDEAEADCARAGRPYLRAVRMRADTDLREQAARFHGARGLLLDACVEGYGGGGRTFDWDWIPAAVSKPLILSGGLNPDNVGEGVRRVRPWGVDVSSGVESAKGIKDAALIHDFCAAVRRADAQAPS